MKKILLFAMIMIMQAIISFAAGSPPNVRLIEHNLKATEKYYAELISGNVTNGAELNMIMAMLPKGGDLHSHYSGAQYSETYIDWLEKLNYCVYSENDAALQAEKYRIEYRPQISEAARKICRSADSVRKDATFYREVLKRWSNKDYNNHYHEQSAPDLQFFDTFGYFWAASNYSFKEGMKILKERAKAENLQYLETMYKGAPDVDKPALAKQINDLPQNSDEKVVFQALAAYADFMAGDPEAQQKISDYSKSMEEVIAGVDDKDFKIRLLSYVSRNNPPAQIFSGLYSAFAATKKTKALVGVNIVGPENGYVAMRDYTLHMQMFKFLNQRFPGTRLSLHAGELALGMVPPEGLKFHIHDAVEVAGAQRIGHGVDISHESNAVELLASMKQKKVAVEVNITSNDFILGVKNEAHPVNLYRRYGVPFVISTDDPGVSRNNLSGEYALFVSRYKPSYNELKEIVFNSIRYSFLRDEEKGAELTALGMRFNKFEADVEKLTKIYEQTDKIRQFGR
jgi:adenosine deaminase/adenosine deaminase CECR1